MTSAFDTDSLTAAGLMRKDVVTLRPDDSVKRALDLIVENHVAGLPVVDAGGRCVGVISMSDILAFEQRTGESPIGGDAWADQYFNECEHRWEAFGLAAFAVEQHGERLVADLMSADVISVAPEASLSEVATQMLNNEIHRILVLDGEQHLQGIISSFDFVRLAT